MQLFRTKHAHGLDRRHSARGKITRQQSRGQQDQPHGAEGREIQRMHAKQHALHRPPHEIGSHQSQAHPDGGEHRGFPHHERYDPVACGAQRHAHRDLMGALGYGKRHHAIDTQCGQKQRHHGEAGE